MNERKPYWAISDEEFFKRYGHERHCNIVHHGTLNTPEDFCDCKASKEPKSEQDPV